MVKKIPVKGYSLFSKKDIIEGKKIGKLLTKEPGDIGRKINEEYYETDMIGRYINHSSKPNTVAKKQDGEYYLFALNEIKQGDEITVNYNDVEEMLGFKKNTFVLDNFVD